MSQSHSEAFGLGSVLLHVVSNEHCSSDLSKPREHCHLAADSLKPPLRRLPSLAGRGAHFESSRAEETMLSWPGHPWQHNNFPNSGQQLLELHECTSPPPASGVGRGLWSPDHRVCPGRRFGTQRLPCPIKICQSPFCHRKFCGGTHEARDTRDSQP